MLGRWSFLFVGIALGLLIASALAYIFHGVLTQLYLTTGGILLVVALCVVLLDLNPARSKS